MKFSYEYRTRDNARRRGVIDAPSRDTVYKILKEQGIRPSSVVEVPGFLNALFGKGKRWMAIGLLSVALIASLVLYLKRGDLPNTTVQRQQVYGDPLVVQQCESAGWSNVFASAGDRLLAAYAQPGREVATNIVATVEEIGTAPVAFRNDDLSEVVLMKRIVNGMKAELREYIADGGTTVQYVERLKERQRIEQRIMINKMGDLERLKTWPESERKRAAEKWNVINKELRSFGLKTVEMPEDLL